MSDDIKERLQTWRKKMPANWYGNRDLDAGVTRIEALEAQTSSADDLIAKLNGRVRELMVALEIISEHSSDQASRNTASAALGKATTQ